MSTSANKGLTYEALYTLLCRIYEGRHKVSHEVLETGTERTVTTFKKITSGLRDSYNWSNQQILSSAPSNTDLRRRIVYALGFRQTETNTILSNVNVHASDSKVPQGPLRKLAGNDSSEKQLPANIDRQEAVCLSALLETPISVLTADRYRQQAAEKESSWFHEVDPLKIEEYALPDEYVGTYFSYYRDVKHGTLRRSPRGIHIGRYFISDLNCFVGLTVLYVPGYVQVSLWVDEPKSLSSTRWMHRLSAFGADIGIAGPCVYTVASPFLSRSPVQIHRMSWLMYGSSIAHAQYRLYTRIFTERTTEVSIWDGPDLTTYRDPWGKELDVIHALRYQGIIGAGAHDPSIDRFILDGIPEKPTPSVRTDIPYEGVGSIPSLEGFSASKWRPNS